MDNTLLTLIQQQFGLQIHETVLPLVEPRSLPLLRSHREIIEWGCLLITPKSNERNRSEFLVAQMMITLALSLNMSLFSGSLFTVQPELGLVGQWDYLMSRSAKIYDIYPPVVCIIEVKRNLERCLPHCLVELVAAQRFNGSDTAIYGVLTTGLQWQFLKLEGRSVTIEQTVYSLEPIHQMIAILAAIIAPN